jgi:hypothetical protein
VGRLYSGYNLAMSLPKEIPLPQWEGAFEALILRLFREVWNDGLAPSLGALASRRHP